MAEGPSRAVAARFTWQKGDVTIWNTRGRAVQTVDKRAQKKKDPKRRGR